MVGGRLVLTGYGGGVNALDPATGRDGRLTAATAERVRSSRTVDRRGQAAALARISWTGAIDPPPAAP